MSVVTLRANAHLAIAQYRTLLMGPSISYHVESEFPTHVFAVTAAELEGFRAGRDYRYWGVINATSTPATYHTYTGPSIPDLWYLVIVNYGAAPAAVYYRVPA